MSNLISAVAWVRRGVAAQNPTNYVLDDKELERISSLAHIELEDARLELERAQQAARAMETRDDSDSDESNWVECA